MRFIFSLIINLLVVASTQAQFASKRQILLFGSPQSTLVRQQLALLEKDALGLQERDMQIKLADGEKRLHSKYKVPDSNAFVLVLVGKDGGEKFRSSKPTDTKELFDIVDAMPMRQSEMRRRKDD